MPGDNSKGIDLEQLHKDVERIVRSLLRRRWSWALRDADDLVQDVFLQILELNGTDKEHDPEKGSLTGYVWHRLLGAIKHGMALKRGGPGEGSRMKREDLDPDSIPGVPGVPGVPNASPGTEKRIYLSELAARSTCPPDVAEYLTALRETTESEDLLHAMHLEVTALAARRRRLVAWLQAEGELPSHVDLEAEYSNYRPTDRNCPCGKALLAYQKAYCSKECESRDKTSKPDVQCLECGCGFKPHPGKKFCSGKCKARYGRNKKSQPQSPPDSRQLTMPWKVDPNNADDPD